MKVSGQAKTKNKANIIQLQSLPTVLHQTDNRPLPSPLNKLNATCKNQKIKGTRAFQ